ncbi:hypothetical protein SPRG_08403 [Saprolegnia parasitica CBS 223.65]|uniref:FAD dependent oxidoreductase domain-containing protein n=1 Tax=Saprolegnia parasitica (strain CBS 223.65) TaxID=695850 RepID=A0A067CAX9_SAPPC|nr:hypothetical protein SPRG_08403 [Saprolegnia parasitica CBS 223.65]KDO26330.1 hypothetical protein SPRG_08403 [Saprolegnia parasitica CBS 223.65]|eukprot:XP_012203029.1 hypothetical protein SPRG_08403 [Saprolegnia parasitica CBS 223.65]
MSASKNHRSSAAMRGIDAPPRSATCHQRVVVLGGGIIGLTTCYYLAKRGHEVVCIEKESQVGMLASFKNGTFFDSTLYSSWADFSVLYRKQTHASSSPKSKQKAFRIEAAAWMDPAFWSWGLKFMTSATSRRAKDNGRKIRDLGFYSQRKLDELIRMHPEIEEAMEQTAEGTLEVFESTAERDEVMHSDRIYHCMEYRLPLQPLDAKDAASVEPALAASVLAPGAIYSATGTNGDVHKTCLAMWQLCRQHGVMFRFNTDITDILIVDNRVVAVQAHDGDLIEGDSFVLALGNHTPAVAKLAGVKLPMYPVKGYVLSVPRNEAFPPLTCNVYAGGNALVSPMADGSLRISGGADFAGFNYKSDPKRVKWLLKQAKRLFPETYLDESKLESHACLRPVSADDVPFIGQTLVDNLFVNTGHGSKGWTLSFGSGALLADQISGRTPEINIEKYSPLRFGLFS